MSLEVKIEDGAIVVRLPIDMLDLVVSACPALYYPEHDRGPNVTRPEEFAEGVVEALKDEAEDGTTLVHRMFDQAFINAIENGTGGVQLPDEEPMT